jgi:hypothetical protein
MTAVPEKSDIKTRLRHNDSRLPDACEYIYIYIYILIYIYINAMHMYVCMILIRPFFK